jgi:hypothetical protein
MLNSKRLRQAVLDGPRCCFLWFVIIQTGIDVNSSIARGEPSRSGTNPTLGALPPEGLLWGRFRTVNWT